MESFVFAFNATMPIVLTVAIGYLLKRIGLMTKEFAVRANKLVFRIFLPTMLFLNVYSIESLSGVDFGYAIYSALLIVGVFLAGIPVVMLTTKDGRRRGALLQTFFRSNNALIGVPLAESLFGAEGAIVMTVLTAFIIPLFNMLGVISLSMFTNHDSAAESGQKAPPRVGFDVKKVLKAIVTNPLIIAIAIGFVALGVREIFILTDITWRLTDVGILFSVLKTLSSVATPLALLSLGAHFEFSVISGMKREIIVGTLARTLVVPALSLVIAYFAFGKVFGGAEFAAILALFCTPVAVSSVPMAQEMGSDALLTGQLVVFTTLFSSLTIFISSFALKFVGIF